MRRFRFAAAFVITGCGAPRSDPHPLVAWQAPLDASQAHATPLDAAPADAELDYAYLCTHFDPAHPVYCNPPPSPPDAMPPLQTMNPPAPARILSEEISGDLTVITIALGIDDGITTRWSGRLVDDRGRAIQGGGFRIFKIMHDRAYAVVKLTPDQIRGARAQLDPPSE